MRPINHVGERFGRWTVIEIAQKRKRGQLCFLCECDCGNRKIVSGSVLRQGQSKSCGCLRKEMGVARGKASHRHGEARPGEETPEYRAWGAMISRCTNPFHKQWGHYGGRGITVCDRWRRSYENFLADMGRRPDRFHTLDRIDNDGSYCPENCRWATWEQQNNNHRKRKKWLKVTLNGETKLLAEWLRIYGISRTAYYKRLQRGWSIEDAITKPIQR